MRKFEGYTRGVNFGGWLSQCDHTKLRYDTFITEEDFREVSLRKFDHVRIPVDYELILSELDSFKDVTPVIGYGQQLELSRDYAFNESGFKYIDFAIEMCKKYSLNMILDLHRTPGYSFDPFHGEKGFFDSEEFQNVFHSIWIEFAKRYGKESDILTFELLNEVTKKEYSDKWNEISETTVKNIRKFAPDIHIIIGGYYNNSLEAIKDLNKPYDDKIVYTFHAYEPLLFTHQGAYWIATMDTSFRCNYDMPYSEYEKLSEKYLCQAYASFKSFDQNAHPDQNFFEELLAEAVRVAGERNVPLYCGEYGVINLADKKEAAKWFSDFHAVMDKYNIGRCVWNFKEMDFEISKDF
ncbi:MAG: cellulase family glycosylhydrolase [Lachnospiraceae bacterium]|nr:cellulase family glycosylhydrolase [Lachnospiraceae bacterium]